MLKTIVHPSVKVVEYIVALKLALYQPQIKHLERITDALIVCDRRKTLTNLYREFVEELDPKTAADFFRESPWQAEEVGRPQRAYMLREYLHLRQMLGDTGPIVISIDDSLGKKFKDTRHLEAVAYLHDHNASSPYRQVYSNGFPRTDSHCWVSLSTPSCTCEKRPFASSTANVSPAIGCLFAASTALHGPCWLK